MSACTEFGRWVDQEILQPVEQFWEDAREVCTEFRRWVEREVRTPLQTWVTREEQRCREQECNWWCLCCNKWFCWVVTVLVRAIVWIVQIVGEWLVETICKLVVEIVRVVVMVVLHVLEWVVEFVLCFIERFCQKLILIAGLALVAALLGGVAGAATAAPPAVIPALIVGLSTAGAALLLARLLCELGLCRLLGVFVWALKWAIVTGAVLAILLGSVGSGFVVVLYGGTVSALIRSLLEQGCPVPRLLGPP